MEILICYFLFLCEQIQSAHESCNRQERNSNEHNAHDMKNLIRILSICVVIIETFVTIATIFVSLPIFSFRSVFIKYFPGHYFHVLISHFYLPQAQLTGIWIQQ